MKRLLLVFRTSDFRVLSFPAMYYIWKMLDNINDLQYVYYIVLVELTPSTSSTLLPKFQHYFMKIAL